MIHIKLKSTGDALTVEKYKVYDPFSIYIKLKPTRDIKYTVTHLYCKKNQGSFKLFCSKIIDISSATTSKIVDDASAIQCLYFEKKMILYADEGNRGSYINNDAITLPIFLLNNKDGITKNVHFWLEYDEGYKLNKEEIELHLNLEYGDEK